MLMRIVAVLPWVILVLWGALPLTATLAGEQDGRAPVDFLTYDPAVTTLARGESLYGTAEQDLTTWRLFHQTEVDLLAAYHRGEGQSAVRALLAGPQEPGPYI
jgi:hypothetical protein